MLNIPEGVKALFSSDWIHKNFHVHFPNGEYRDLTNEDIVSESVSFTESLCSQQYFKFGLAEASQIEFTAVGIPNVRGAYIECAIEIDCTRLGSEWAADNPVDDTLDFLEPQTCEYGGKLYYRVPYGRFKVDTCPRDHGAMWQRQITAYSDMITQSTQLNSFEEVKANTLIPMDNVYTPNLELLFYELIGSVKAVEAAGWTKTERTSNININRENQLPIYYVGSSTAQHLAIVSTKRQYAMPTKGGNSKPEYLAFVDSDRDFKRTRSEMEAYILTLDIDWPTTLAANDCDDKTEFFDLLFGTVLYPEWRHSYNAGNIIYGTLVTVYPTEENVLMYPHIGSDKLGYFTNAFLCPMASVGVEGTDINGNTFGETFTSATRIAVYTYEKPEDDVFSTMKLSISSTLKQAIYVGIMGKKVQCYSFANAYSPYKFINGFLELSGWFLRTARTGAIEFYQMSENPAAVPVPRSDWSEFWWDENPIDSIGQVNVKYTEKGEEQQKTFQIGDGNSVYTMEDNEVLNIASLEGDTIQNVLNTYFAPNAKVVNFTPVDLEMRGLPYFESGDYIQLTAEDGATVETYILSQTISGIQHLTATVTSTNGELLEVIENE